MNDALGIWSCVCQIANEDGLALVSSNWVKVKEKTQTLHQFSLIKPITWSAWSPRCSPEHSLWWLYLDLMQITDQHPASSNNQQDWTSVSVVASDYKEVQVTAFSRNTLSWNQLDHLKRKESKVVWWQIWWRIWWQIQWAPNSVIHLSPNLVSY